MGRRRARLSRNDERGVEKVLTVYMRHRETCGVRSSAPRPRDNVLPLKTRSGRSYGKDGPDEPGQVRLIRRDDEDQRHDPLRKSDGACEQDLTLGPPAEHYIEPLDVARVLRDLSPRQRGLLLAWWEGKCRPATGAARDVIKLFVLMLAERMVLGDTIRRALRGRVLAQDRRTTLGELLQLHADIQADPLFMSIVKWKLATKLLAESEVSRRGFASGIIFLSSRSHGGRGENLVARHVDESLSRRPITMKKKQETRLERLARQYGTLLDRELKTATAAAKAKAKRVEFAEIIAATREAELRNAQ